MNAVANLNLKSMVSPQALQDHQELHTSTTIWMTMSTVANITTRSVPRLMIVTIKAIMNIHINLKANHNMVPHLW
jgi:hypothetical protein